MRKKSHISVAKGIIDGLELDSTITHRISFYIGSIWPDCMPSFVTRRHCIDDTFHILQKRMTRFIKSYNNNPNLGRAKTLRMGILTHYVADYFTFPHNTNYNGNLKEHCIYERDLKFKMYEYINNNEHKKLNDEVHTLGDYNEIMEYIVDNHNKYMENISSVDRDCKYALLSCMCLIASILGSGNPDLISVNV